MSLSTPGAANSLSLRNQQLRAAAAAPVLGVVGLIGSGVLARLAVSNGPNVHGWSVHGAGAGGCNRVGSTTMLSWTLLNACALNSFAAVACAEASRASIMTTTP